LINDEIKLNPFDMPAGQNTLIYCSRGGGLRAGGRGGAGEALWFNVHNYLQSASVANVFVVKGGAIVTPPTAEELRDPAVAAACPYSRSNVLPGVMRGAVMDVARSNGMEVRVGAMTVNDVLEADEVFLTNSIMRVMPVGRVEKHVVGDGNPGVVTRRVMDGVNEMGA
jgi:branched-chain amino acid aminotransferase